MIKMIYVCDRCNNAIYDRSLLESCEFIYDGKRLKLHYHTECFALETALDLKLRTVKAKVINGEDS